MKNMSDETSKNSQAIDDCTSKKTIREQINNLDFDLKNWNLSVKQVESEYEFEVNLNVGVKSKKINLPEQKR